MEGCGPCKRAVPDVPLSDAGRTSRDVLCAAFFIAFAIGDLVIALIGFQQGQPQALIYGLDYAGNVCGRNNQVRKHAAPLEHRAAGHAPHVPAAPLEQRAHGGQCGRARGCVPALRVGARSGALALRSIR
jgi:hypothetical protein